jgi:voltage-gated potassium channel
VVLGPRESLAERPVLRRTLVPIASFVAVIFVTVVGYVALAGVGVVEATFWLISPDSIALYYRDQGRPGTATKAFAVVMRVAIALSGLWIGRTAVSALFGGQIAEEITNVQQERKLERLQDHVVICGYGIFGRTIAERLADDHEIVVVELNESEALEAERDGHLVVKGDARTQSVLERARVGVAETVIAAVDDSNVNIQIAIVAREIAVDGSLVVRVGDGMYESMARQAGADTVIIPEVLSGEDIAERL